MTELKIVQENGRLLADSRDVAEMVSKNHADLLRDIKKYVTILSESNFALADFFIESFYNDSQGKPRPHFFLTKKGCDMVANKLTGSKGVLFTAAYVTKFEEMEKTIQHSHMHSYMIEDPIRRAERWIEEQKQKMALETKNLMLEQQVAESKPKVTYYDEILKSTGVVTITQIAKDYGMSGQALNDLLHENGVQYKQSGQWLLYHKYQDRGYTKSETQSYRRSNGETGTKLHTKWTQKGRLFIYNLLSKLDIEPLMDREQKKEA
ncbi:phage regulatory protein/antirepressor Ant [Rossellomorea vietnamensis]|uniref:phage regulatory protein/antirepressor Ant n=1 Tax=Rossellomorea vietnamensis TaxID=218284 RepID=UPI000555555E|nr:phage regulatory protein/antirepressor Ant [Rossellomorea vietnamensis]